MKKSEVLEVIIEWHKSMVDRLESMVHLYENE